LPSPTAPDYAIIQVDNQTLQWNHSIPFNLDVDEFQRLLSGDAFAPFTLEI